MGTYTSKHLIKALDDHNYTSISRIADQIDINAKIDVLLSKRALDYAIDHNDWKMVACLLDCGADQSLSGFRGNTPLMNSIDKSEVFQTLLMDYQHTRTRKNNVKKSLLTIRSDNNTILSILINAQNWENVFKVIMTLCNIDVKNLANLLLSKDSNDNIPFEIILRNAPEPILAKILNTLNTINDIVVLKQLFDNDCYLNNSISRKSKIVDKIIILQRKYFTQYSKINTLCNQTNNCGILDRLLYLDVNNGIYDNYSLVINLLSKKNALEFLEYFIKEKLSNNHYDKLPDIIEKRFSDIIPKGTIIDLIDVINEENLIKQQLQVKDSVIKTNFSDIIGQRHAIEVLRDYCIVPIRRFLSRNIKLTNKNTPAKYRRFLFYGPAGTGKSLLSKTLAHELDVPFISISVDATQSEYYGQTERRLRSTMETGVKLANTPDVNTGKCPGACVIVFEEFDSFASKVNESSSNNLFLIKINSCIKQIFEIDNYPELIVCASVNRMSILDPPIKQRFPTPILCALPDKESRCQILVHTLKKASVELGEGVDLNKWGNNTELYCGRDIVQMANELIEKVKRIHHRWIINRDGTYHKVDRDAKKYDFEGTAYDLELDGGKKYDLLVLDDVETNNMYRMTENEFEEYMRDAMSNDPNAESIFNRIRNSSTPESDSRPEKDDNSLFGDLKEMLLKIINNGISEHSPNSLNDIFTHAFEATTETLEQMRQDNIKEGLLLDNWTVKVIVNTIENNKNKWEIISLIVNKHSTIDQLQDLILNHDHIQEIIKNSSYSCIRLLNPYGSTLLPKDEKIEDVLFHNCNISLIFQN